MLTKSPIDLKDLRDINHCLVLGKLANPIDSVIPGLGETRDSITKHISNNNLILYVQAISREPKLFSEQLHKDPKTVYITFDDNNQAFLRSIKYYDASDKLQYLREYLDNKLILFKPKLRERKSEGPEQYHYNFDIVWVGDQVDADFYVPVPRVERDLSSQRFDTFLKDKKPFRIPSYPNLMETPEFLLCEKYLYYIPKPDIITSVNIRTTYYCQDPNIVKKIEIPHDWDEKTRAAHPDFVFIPDVYAGELRSIFDKNGFPITIKDLPDVTSTQKLTKLNDRSSEGDVLSVTKERVIKEYEFINKLRYLAHEERLVYEEADLYNFHVALKTNFVTILGGMSGTGKTKLALLYAKALGLVNGDNLLVIPVSPSYSEPSDILGYLNQQLGIYIESETGLVSFLQRAELQPEKMFMVIFDEMNLGQVEHYFSPFISLLEMDDEDRKLSLFSDNAICRDKTIKSKIRIGRNILFVGTANFDETTKDFSKRLLDRANVIHLQKYNFQDAKNKEFIGDKPNVNQQISSEIFNKKWTCESQGLNGLEYEEVELLDRLHEKLRNADAQTGVSFRIFKGVGDYLGNIPEDENGTPMLSRSLALDYQIRQRILTKIRGHREQIESLVGYYDFQKDVYNEGDLSLLFRDEGWDFPYSREFLIQKAKELTRNGYAY
ncbi:McrB family protein [Paenibacillus sp. MSJ-34]|uniref:McrB family protein n=1 Tax=Paenibacillus sp. MSJ-34 TaxID=2841529 RepID=UPI001C10692A|nr:hypothetical protein [Paenibacillus sp. MSJ-34]MBU5445427.1 hypothetical protein [Paenibacillus sp. MSJ-34]